MQKPFIKIKTNYCVKEFVQHDMSTFFTQKIDNVDRGLFYYNATLSEDDVSTFIPKEYRNGYEVVSMFANSYLPPHTDSHILSTINIYTQPSNCRTVFYKLKEGNNPTTYKLQHQSNGEIFDINDLEEIDSFVAEEGDVYLMDVTLPHSVIPLTSDEVNRIAIKIQSLSYTYDETVKMITEYMRP